MLSKRIECIIHVIFLKCIQSTAECKTKNDCLLYYVRVFNQLCFVAKCKLKSNLPVFLVIGNFICN